jgi:hypothetical protein
MRTIIQIQREEKVGAAEAMRLQSSERESELAEARGSAARCGAWGCHDADLVWMKAGDDCQTKNGFLIAKLDGWYCPVCAGSYGNSKPQNTTI